MRFGFKMCYATAHNQPNHYSSRPYLYIYRRPTHTSSSITLWKCNETLGIGEWNPPSIPSLISPKPIYSSSLCLRQNLFIPKRPCPSTCISYHVNIIDGAHTTTNTCSRISNSVSLYPGLHSKDEAGAAVMLYDQTSIRLLINLPPYLSFIPAWRIHTSASHFLPPKMLLMGERTISGDGGWRSTPHYVRYGDVIIRWLSTGYCVNKWHKILKAK